MTTTIPQGICVLVDGGCLNNNKPVSERRMYGSFRVYYNGKPVVSTWGDKHAEQHKFEFPTDRWASNNLAELLAMENALSYIWKLKDRQAKTNITSITVLCDSAFALGYADGTFTPGKKVDASLLEAHSALSNLTYELDKWGVDVKFQHVDESWVKTQLGH